MNYEPQLSFSHALAAEGIKPKQLNPAYVYLLSLAQGASRYGMEHILLRTARLFGYPDLDTCPWEHLTATELLALKAILERNNMAPNTINLYLAALRGVVRAAWQLGLITDHDKLVLDSIKGARGSRLAKGRALTLVESARLIDCCLKNKTPKGIRDAAIFSLGIGCGMRRHELATLKMSAFNPAEKIIRIIGKGNKERDLVGADIVWIRLQNWLDIRGKDGCDNIFVRVNKHQNILTDKTLSDVAIFKMMIKRAEESGIEAFSPHDLRRTFATRMLAAGADISIVKEAMGHSSISTTQLYDRRGLEDIRVFASAIPV